MSDVNSDKLESSQSKNEHISSLQDSMQYKEGKGELIEVEVSVKIPARYKTSDSKEGELTFEDLDRYILNLDQDKDWWGLIKESIRLNGEAGDPVVTGMQWTQILWFMGTIHHFVEVLDKKPGYMKTVAVPLPIPGNFNLSYIAEYIIQESEDPEEGKYFIFTLIGKLNLPRILKPAEGAVAAFTNLVSKYNLNKLRQVFTKGKFLES